MSDQIERFYAALEAVRNEAEEAYFAARPQADTLANRAVFRAGFDRAFQYGARVFDIKLSSPAEGATVYAPTVPARATRLLPGHGKRPRARGAYTPPGARRA